MFHALSGQGRRRRGRRGGGASDCSWQGPAVRPLLGREPVLCQVVWPPEPQPVLSLHEDAPQRLLAWLARTPGLPMASSGPPGAEAGLALLPLTFRPPLQQTAGTPPPKPGVPGC